MNELDFYVQAILARTVAGIGIGSSPEEIAERLGYDFIDDQQRSRLRRDYGLLEFSFVQNTGWTCWSIGIQVHRLRQDIQSVTPEPLSTTYGEFSNRLSYDRLKSALIAADTKTSFVLDHESEEFQRIRVTPSRVIITVVKNSPAPEGGSFRIGDVWAIHMSGAG